MRIKTFLNFAVIILLVLSLFSCSTSDDEKSLSTFSSEELDAILDLTFSSDPLADLNGQHVKLDDQELKEIISAVPKDKYEHYPELQIVPSKATLYKDGEEISIDISDPRLIGLINLYNNSVYSMQYAYTQGVLDMNELELYKSQEPRLELTYTPHGDYWPTPFDTIIVTNEWFVCISHDIPAYDGMYPHTAFGRVPLCWEYPWLDLFGF